MRSGLLDDALTQCGHVNRSGRIRGRIPIGENAVNVAAGRCDHGQNVSDVELEPPADGPVRPPRTVDPFHDDVVEEAIDDCFFRGGPFLPPARLREAA